MTDRPPPYAVTATLSAIIVAATLYMAVAIIAAFTSTPHALLVVGLTLASYALAVLLVLRADRRALLAALIVALVLLAVPVATTALFAAWWQG